MTTGQVFDLGYQPYRGPRQGRVRACLALYTNSLKTAFGIGRGGRAKIFPWSMLGISIIPAFIGIGIAALLNQRLAIFRFENWLDITALILTLFSAVVAPELLCPDRRNRVLNLYFAHAITRLDYAAMKGAALMTALLVMTLVPQVVLFLGYAFADRDTVAYVRANAAVLPRVLVAAVTVSLFLGMIALAIASLTPRRILAAGATVAVFLISTATATALWATFESGPARLLMLVSLAELPFAATSWIFGTAYGPQSLAEQTDLPGALLFALTFAYGAAAAALLAWRYARWQP
jgi:ABC-2 type transport system permease protein